MNKQKICFITCVNDMEVYEECLMYLNNLEIPDGYQVENIYIEDAECVTKAYNEAMKASDAKYKVYMHQDVFIINKNFIYDILNVFHQDAKIGMLGVIGAKTIPTSGIWRESNHKYGKIYDSSTGTLELLSYKEVEDDFKVVKVIDEQIMVTQYDIPWRADIFDGWHFYDLSQSVEFAKQGYNVVVPRQVRPWCIHDCDIVNFRNGFEEFRKIFLDKYSEVLIKMISDDIEKQAIFDDEEAIEWRNYCINKVKGKIYLRRIDEYLIKKYNIYSEEPNELFDFDKITALQIINTNKNQFNEYLYNAKINLYNKDYEQASRWCHEAAKYASENHPGFYTSIDIESILIECAKHLPIVYNDVKIPKEDNSKRKVLHVLSEGYSIGGHTRLVRNWIEKDKNSKHSLITTWQMNTTPGVLINAVNESSGWTYTLQHISTLIERAATLRKMAYEWADVVVLHVHMHDPIPVMAFGVEGGPPVIFMNHADHLFWIGTTIIDNLLDFRLSGKELSIARRKVFNNTILPLPLAQPNPRFEDKQLTRQKLGIKENEVVLLSIASPYKFKSFGRMHHIDFLKKILQDNKNALAIVIGPDNSGEWEKAHRETNGRILPLGIKQDIEQYYCIADIYIDSYMIASVTSALDGGLHGLPIVAWENDNNRTLSFDDISYDNSNKKFFGIDDYRTYINLLIRDKNYREKAGKDLSNKIKEEHIYNWEKYLNSAYKKVEGKGHKLYFNNDFDSKLNNEDLFLALFQKSEVSDRKNRDKKQNITSIELKEIAEVTNKKTTTRKLKIVFLTQHAANWSSTESVWKAFKEDERCEVQIIQLPFYHPGYDQVNNECKGGSYLTEKNMPFKYWYKCNLAEESPDVVFFQSPYDHNRPTEFSVSAIEELGCKIVYIPYGFELIKNYPNTTDDYIQALSSLPILQKCWRVFLRSNRSKKMYSKYSSRGDEHMIVTGHPKIDFVVDSQISKSEIIKKYSNINGRKVILWNPNLGEFGGDAKWDIHFEILRAIEKFHNVIVIFRPHPLQVEKIKSIETSTDILFEKFKKLLLQVENIILDDSPDYRESVELSDGFISCASSLILEYLATGKPIMYTPQAYPDVLNDDGDIIESLYIGDSFSEIVQFFRFLVDGIDPLKEKRLAVIPEFIYATDGNNGKRIEEYIINQVQRELINCDKSS